MVYQDLVAEARNWIRKYNAACRKLNAEEWVSEFFTHDAELSYLGQPTIKGREALVAVFKTQFQLLDDLDHMTQTVDVVNGKVYHQANVRYLLKGNQLEREVIIPAIGIYERDPEEAKLRSLTVYFDPSALYKALGE